ncbi:MAG: chromosomal replication initiator protein DnaA, partial [Thermoplasmata archaeon]
MVEELNELKNRVLSIKNTEYSYLVRDIEKYLNDPGKIDEIKIALRDAELKIQEKMAEEIRKKEEIKERERQKEMLYELLAKAGEVGGVETGKAEIGKEEIKLEASISPTYTFNNFVVGEFNRFAYAAAKAVAEKPGTVYNPLFIWSGPGLGKTHLLNAIANYIKDNNPDMKVLYTTTEKFSNDLIEALQNNKLLSFRQKYRNVDVLIVDDVQFLAGRERTQEEFFHTFNTLFTVDKQIVLACDRPPKDIPSLEQRLVSRFEGGLIAQITPPDFESRVAILRQKAKENGWTVEDDVLNYIAQHFENNIRELE